MNNVVQRQGRFKRPKTSQMYGECFIYKEVPFFQSLSSSSSFLMARKGSMALVPIVCRRRKAKAVFFHFLFEQNKWYEARRGFSGGMLVMTPWAGQCCIGTLSKAVGWSSINITCKTYDMLFQALLEPVQQSCDEIIKGIDAVLRTSPYNTWRTADSARSEYDSLNLKEISCFVDLLGFVTDLKGHERMFCFKLWVKTWYDQFIGEKENVVKLSKEDMLM